MGNAAVRQSWAERYAELRAERDDLTAQVGRAKSIKRRKALQEQRLAKIAEINAHLAKL